MEKRNKEGKEVRVAPIKSVVLRVLYKPVLFNMSMVHKIH
jgi:hypothetical protein